MNASGDTADQVVKMTLEGIEVAANIALKAGGTATRSLAAMLYAILTDQKKVKGKARLDTLLKSGKELKVFAIRNQDLKLFCQEAKKYGVLYSVLKEKNNVDGICDIMVRAEDAAKISRIVDKFELATIDTKAIRESILNNKNDSLGSKIMDEKEHDDLINSLMSTVNKNEDIQINPNLARTQIKKESQFEQKSQKLNNIEDIKRPSVRKELQKIKIEKETKRKMYSPKVGLKTNDTHNKNVKSKNKRKRKVR